MKYSKNNVRKNIDPFTFIPLTFVIDGVNSEEIEKFTEIYDQYSSNS